MHNRTVRWIAVALALAFVASACSGEVDDGATEVGGAGSDDGADETTDGPEDSAAEAPAEPATTPDPGPDAEPNFYDDPRGGVFSAFQATYDRGDGPFTQVDAVCLPNEPAPNRVATDPGITADTVSIGHIRSRLETAVDIGFGIPVGDPKEMFEVFVDYINNECGGIRGRQIILGYAEADLFGADVDASRNQACLAMTEDFDSVIIMNSSGFQGSANLCIVEEQETAFISTQGQTEEFMNRGDDRLISLSMTLEESLRFTAGDLIESGALEGKSIGVAAPNTPGQLEAVEEGLVKVLRDAGFDPVFDEIDCAGSSICTGGVPQSVSNMVDAEVDVFFNVMNILTAPGYIAEMVNQGYEPGDVQFYATDFNSQTSELVSGQIANNVDAGNLYDGAIIIDFRTTGEYRDQGYAPNPFAIACNEVYSANSPSGAGHDWTDEGDSAYGMVGSVCSIVRIAVRAIYDAGDNPTIADIQAALANLGPVDNNALAPASIRPGKTQSADIIQTLDFSFPCTLPLPFTRASGDPVCITGRGDFRPAPR
jgi:hypothetical protein